MEKTKAKEILLACLYHDKDYGNIQVFRGEPPHAVVEYCKRNNIPIDIQSDERIFREAIWELLTKGIIIPGNRKNSADFPWVTLSDYGIKCVENGKIILYDPDRLTDTLYKKITNTDVIVKMYFEEAISCFNNADYLASTVMIGGAIERTVILLTEEFYNHLTKNKTTYKKDVLDAWKIKTKFDKFREFLETHGYEAKLTQTTKEKLSSVLPAIFNLIRISRNEIGHPTGREMSRDEANANLLLAKEGMIFCHDLLGELK